MSDETKLGPVARRLAATTRVLCVEDEPDIALFLRAYFRAAGYDLVHIDPRSSDEIIDAVDEHGPDIILMDVRLRGFSGMDAYQQIRALERFAFVPVIIVTAHPESDPLFAAADGIDTVVGKPFNTNTLADLVRDRIEAAKALAAVGRSEGLQLLTQEYLAKRIADEIALGQDRRPLSFVLIRMRSIGEIRAEVGEEGMDFLAISLIEDAQPRLPTGAVIGITSSEELAVLLPGLGPRDAFTAMRPILEHANGDFTFPGGAVVPVQLSAGLAAFPDNAKDADGLFMAADVALAEAIDEDAVLHRAL